ncbi:MAG: molybdopterin-dependent oxidoreductase, partial [Proteobacteria bacterium]|nr:molybdopterin-dependent oxidoreductase [Pseudomonadota bacterium]
ELDCHDPQAALAAMQKAQFVVALSAFRHKATEYADVLLPISPFTETPGAFISTEGRLQGFHAAVKPLGESRPGWKVLRVLGGLLGFDGFGFETADEVRAECLQGRDVAALLSNKTTVAAAAAAPAAKGIQRVADVPAYFADALVRRAGSLQKAADAKAPRARMNAKLMAELGIADGDRVLVRLGSGEARLEAAADERVAQGCVRIAAAHPSTAALGPMFGEVSVEKLTVREAA